MAKGENIFRRRDGRWEARYIKGRELSGKIKYGYCYGKTYREAKEKAAKRKAALENGALLPTATTQKPFSSYCLEWLHTKKCTVKESTYIKYSTVVNKHIMPKLGECCPLGFTTELMDDFIKELQFEDELAPKTVHDILVVLHGILKFASSKFAGSFPAVEINYPKIGKKEMRVLSREEQARLVAYLNEDLDSCRFGILLALCTGIRIGELCALQWESVSTNDKAIRIAKTLQRLHDTSVSQGARTRIVIGPPKSDTSVRTIPMTEYVTGLCRRMKPQSSAAYVLTGTEAFMEPLHPLLASWPEKEDTFDWAQMYNIYWHNVPRGEQDWKRVAKPERRRGRIAYLKQATMFRYVYHHFAIVEEGLLQGDKYQSIALHEDVLFSYFEEPKRFTNIQRDPTRESKAIQDWLDVDPESHFIPLPGSEGQNFLLLPDYFALGQED